MKIKTFVRENDFCVPSISHGWGNGYAVVDKEHPLYGKSYSDEFKLSEDQAKKIKFNGNFIGLLCNCYNEKNKLSLDMLINVHGGITFSKSIDYLIDGVVPEEIKKEFPDGWVFGFDTCHCDDNISNWPEEAVRKETEKLKNELIKWAKEENNVKIKNIQSR